MNKLLLRISGIIFFGATLAMAMPVFSRNLDSYAFFISCPDVGWGLYYVLTAVIFTAFFFFTLFSTGTAAIFAGSGGYVQSVWNCGIYGLFCIGFFTSQLLFFGIDHEEEYLLMLCIASVFGLILYNVLIYFALRKEETFSYKNIFSVDSNSKLCFKVFGLMMAVVEIGAFLYAHKFVE